MDHISRLKRFLEEDIWRISSKDLSYPRGLLIKTLRIFLLAIFEFRANNCISRATVLTYYSLLNIVPLLAVFFAIAKGFGLKRIVEGYIYELSEKVHLQPEMTNQIIGFANKVLIQAKGGVIAGIGVILLFWTVISILGKVEETFNTVWKVKQERTLIRKFTDYISVMVLAPVLFALASSATLLISSQLKMMIEKIVLFKALSVSIIFFLNFLPYLAVWVLMTGLYMVMPNTKIPLRSAIFAGIAAGTIYQIIQWLYIKFQIGVASYSAIYGSFAALPLFLGWLQISWMILIFGSELSYAYEHHETFGFHPDYSRIGFNQRRFLMLRVLRLLIVRFINGEKPIGVKEIAVNLQIPVSFVKTILNELTKTGLICEVVEGEGHRSLFQPAKPVEGIRIKTFLDSYEDKGNDIPDSTSEDYLKLKVSLLEISGSIDTSPGNVRIMDL
ncbi:MAG: YihY/virulence factor BrkB family protein [Syntrophorhabdaceae bacterium]|nr:YihY/virulence factor BrkB family protein [Syntrophorhabdaceae bacterium]